MQHAVRLFLKILFLISKLHFFFGLRAFFRIFVSESRNPNRYALPWTKTERKNGSSQDRYCSYSVAVCGYITATARPTARSPRPKPPLQQDRKRSSTSMASSCGRRPSPTPSRSSATCCLTRRWTSRSRPPARSWRSTSAKAPPSARATCWPRSMTGRCRRNCRATRRSSSWPRTASTARAPCSRRTPSARRPTNRPVPNWRSSTPTSPSSGRTSPSRSCAPPSTA